MTNALYDALLAPHRGSERSFLVTDDGGQISYGAFVARVVRIANVLADAGVRPGDRVAAQVPKRAEALALYGAAL